MLRYLPPLALTIVSVALFYPATEHLEWLTGYAACATGYAIGSCWLLYLLRGPSLTRPQRYLRIGLRLLIAAPPAILFVGGFVEAATTANDLAVEGSYLVLLPGMPIWIAALVTPWLTRTKPADALGPAAR